MGQGGSKKHDFSLGGSMKRVLYAFCDAFLMHVETSKTDVFEGAKNGPLLGPPALFGALRGSPQAASESVFGSFLARFLAIVFWSRFLVQNTPT